MKSLLAWIDERTGLMPAVCKWLDPPAARRGCCYSRVWPATIGFSLAVQLVTGFFLWMYYSPSTRSAWESVYFLQYEVTGGWLLRAVHHYSAQVMLVLIGLYMLQMILAASYRKPRELVFWTVVLMGLFCLGSLLTGDLLAWDQNSCASTQVRVSFLNLLPVVGGSLYKLAAGGPAFGHLTLTRFFTLHVGLLSAGLVVLWLLHAVLQRRAATVEAEADAAEAEADNNTDADADAAKKSGGCWSSQALCNAVACAIVLAVVLLLSVRHGTSGDGRGVTLGSPADLNPANFYSAARPEWAFLGLYQFSNMFPGGLKIVPIFIVPGLLVCTVLAMPWIGRGRMGPLFNIGLTVVLLVGLTILSFACVAHDRDNEDHQQALADGEREAQRVVELARGQGIPATGALTLLQNDPKTRGPKLGKQVCASCHTYGAIESDVPETGALIPDNPSAPELYGFASRKWVRGLMDPEQIGGPLYFGNTRFATGAMVRYVESRFAKLEEADREAIIAALSAEAGMQFECDGEPAAEDIVAKGRELIASEECARCHVFHDAGQGGSAPVLTGYGSREWLIGVIADPTHGALYGGRNDRMPTYVAQFDKPAENLLSAADVELVADWLQEDWYRTPSEGEEEGEEADESQPARRPVILTLNDWQTRRDDVPPMPEETGPHAEARTLYRQELCSLCHAYTVTDGSIPAVSSAAPDLGGFASREWVAGMLDAEQIKGPKYYGNTAFSNGKMVKWLVKDFPELAEDLEEDAARELEVMGIALSAEAKLPSQKELDERDAERIEEGREKIGIYCGDCHKFHGEGSGSPDLTGYGSREWLIEFITDPKRFYGKDNDGMPSYRGSPEHPGRNLLTPEQIAKLADFLRGETPGEE